MSRVSLFLFFFFCTAAVSLAEPSTLPDYYAKAISNQGRFAQRLLKDGKAVPWDNLGVRSLIDYCYVIAMANADLPESQRPSPETLLPVLTLAEEMQDKNPQSRSFGNFRWYWRTPEVTDMNAVEFVAAHALPVWFEAKDKLPPEARLILERMLRRAVDGCLKHSVRSDYTNIAICNFVHLIILGQEFDRPDAVKEGERRMRLFTAALWNHGVFEYNSPTYYAVNVDALQLGFRYIKDKESKETLNALLDYFWTDLALNWYKPGQRHAGAQSRTYNYLYGVSGTTRLFAFAGLAPGEKNAGGADYLNSYHAVKQPAPELLALNEKYPRLVERQWGSSSAQWATGYFLPDIVLGTAGAPYIGARQNMVLTVDLADYETLPAELPPLLARNYFIADGREDPYGKVTYPTSNAGHNKALHLEAFWMGAQRTTDALGVTLHTPKTLNDPVATNVQSHFVFRKPEAILLDGKSVELKNEPVEIADKPVVFRYGERCFGIRVLWTRDKDGKAPKAYLFDDSNKFGVQRLTIDHWGPRDMPNRPKVSYDGLTASTGAAFWVRIGSQLDTEEKFNAWCRSFAAAKVESLEVQGDNISIRVAGTDGTVSVTGTPQQVPDNLNVQTEPPRPEGILMLNGQDVGSPILAKIPNIAYITQRQQELKPVIVESGETYWESEGGLGFSSGLYLSETGVSGGGAVQVDSDFQWKLNVKKSGTYYLWARVFAADPEHDSFHIEWSKERSNGLLESTAVNGEWHIGSGKNWRWIPLRLNDKRPDIPLQLEPGTWRLILRPREPGGKVDRFFLTTDPQKKPE